MEVFVIVAFFCFEINITDIKQLFNDVTKFMMRKTENEDWAMKLTKFSFHRNNV